MARRRLSQSFDPVLTIDATRTKVKRLVYLLVANRPVRYGKDYSRIVYIGTTKNGIERIAGSASKRVTEALKKESGIKRLDAYVVWTSTKRGPQSVHGKPLWHILERALILAFKYKYNDDPPRLNIQGRRFREHNEFDIFAYEAVERIINRYT